MNTGEIVSRYTKAFLEFVGDAPDRKSTRLHLTLILCPMR